VGCEAGSYLRLIDSCITQLKAQGPSRTCNESNEEEEDSGRPDTPLHPRCSCRDGEGRLSPDSGDVWYKSRPDAGDLWYTSRLVARIRLFIADVPEEGGASEVRWNHLGSKDFYLTAKVLRNFT